MASHSRDAPGGRSWALAALAAALSVVAWSACGTPGAAGQLPLCGAWCDDAAAGTACEIDQRVTPCAGGDWCKTSCEQWAHFHLGDPLERKVSCETFARAGAYAKGGLPCDPACLSPEIRPSRYPSPTGLGFFCDPGTCNPPVQARYANDSAALARGMRVLECPCRWFASDCTEGRETVRAVLKAPEGVGASEGGLGLQVLRLEVSPAALRRLVDGHRPGGAVRVVLLESDGSPREQPYALVLPAAPALPQDLPHTASASEEGEEGSAYLELLSGPVHPEEGLHPSVTMVGSSLRSLPFGRSAGAALPSELFLYPTISGFHNRRYSFLLDALGGSPQAVVEHVFVVATGSGLFGAGSAVASLQARAGGAERKRIHVFYGLRALDDIPPELRPLVAGWARGGEGGAISLTLVLSGKGADSSTSSAASTPDPQPARPKSTRAESADPVALDQASTDALRLAVQRGQRLRGLHEQAGGTDAGGRFYVQHALEAAFRAADARAEHGATFRNTAVVGCSRTDVLDALDGVWARGVCETADDVEGCRQLASERIFINV